MYLDMFRLKILYSAANDPQIGPQMIPDVDRKWSPPEKASGMDFGFLDFFLDFFSSFIFYQLKR